MDKGLVDIALTVITDNPDRKAICVQPSGDMGWKQRCWLPRSEISYEKGPYQKLTIITMPKWLAEKEHLT